MAPLVWLITGATSGLGRALVSKLIEKGDKVVATGRNAEKRLADLKSESVAVVDLDVSAPREEVSLQVQKAWEAFGQIDILVNNAGMSAPKAIEEGSDQFMQDMFSVNVFGPVRITQCILPYFRAQGHGKIAFIGAGVSWGPIPFLSHYSAAKSALNGFVEGLRKELRNQPIQCTIMEPGGFASQLGQARSGSDEGFGKYQPEIPPYVELFGEVMGVFGNEIMPNIPGDVKRFATQIIDLMSLMDGQEAEAQELPVRVVLGSDAVAVVKQKCNEQLALLEKFKEVSKGTDRDDAHTLNYGGTLKLTSMMQ